MIDRQAIAEARRVLGCQLAELRKAAGYSQHRFAPLTMYARGTLANVEIGRQHVARSFWQRCDEELGTDGALTRSFDDLDALSRRRHEQAAQQAADEVAEPTGPDSPQQQANHGEWAVTWDPMRWRTLFAWGLTTTAATGLGAGSADVARRMSLGGCRSAATHRGPPLSSRCPAWRADAVAGGSGFGRRGSPHAGTGQLPRDGRPATAHGDRPQLRRAVASSLLADARGSAQAIRQARTTLDRERDEPAEEWCAFVTPFEIDGIEATCALELGHAARAQRLLEAVVLGHEPRFRRNRALYGAWLAQARLDNAEVEGAAEAADAVLDDLSGHVASRKVNSELDTVARGLADHPHVDGVSQFLDRYRAVSA